MRSVASNPVWYPRPGYWRRVLTTLLLLVPPMVVRAADAVRAIPSSKLIVVGFLGGNIRGSDLLRKEAQLAKKLEETYPLQLQAGMFANRDGQAALASILLQLDTDGDGRLSEQEKQGARIVLYGHSWGASQAVTLARQLDALHIPVLLTVQVDSVEKRNQQDGRIPPNVREAANFYQAEGLLRGRNPIVAVDPRQTTILGNYLSSYREHPVSCVGFPWYARVFMRQHIEIENDAVVWARIEALIRTKVL